MDNTKKLPTCVSLCSGYGGIERGIESVIGPLNVLSHVEVEAFAIANLVDKMEAGQMVPAPIWTDIKTFPVGPFRGRVDILTGGYPCQPFSAAGKRKGKDDPRHLWPWIKEIIREIKPGICLFENVEGHVTLGLREVLTDLVELGYRVENDCGEPTWGIFSAREVGAPHQRKRVFIMAYAEGTNWGLTQGRIHGTPVGECSPRGIRETSNDLVNAIGQGSQRLGYPWEEGEAIPATTTNKWPARPGEPQYGWEEPRTIKPGLGGKPNGTPNRMDPNRNRIDRLRLLGNGVVPATAAKAFRVLWGRLANTDKKGAPRAQK